jgi:hypothetical protein
LDVLTEQLNNNHCPGKRDFCSICCLEIFIRDIAVLKKRIIHLLYACIKSGQIGLSCACV